MNNATSQYFISCVSKELGSYRRMLKHHLSALRGGVEVKIQEDFIQGNDTLLEELNAFVRDCEGVIHLVGERCGELPTDQHAQVLEQLLQRAVENRYSMTQWEYHLARHHDKRTLVYLTSPETRIDEPVEQSENAAGIQQAHRVGIHGPGKCYDQFNNHQQLRRLVFRDLSLDEGRYIANLPFASLGSLFKGRDEVLTTLKDGLGLQDHRHYQGVMAITAKTSAAMHGLGGIGKTRAAVEFATQYREDYCALLFCIADSSSALINNIATFCGPKLLDLPAQHEKETELQYQAALHWLKQHPGWLLIIDNVDSEEAATEVQKLAGELSGSGQILITSRISDWPGSMLTAALDVLDSGAAIAFLLERTNRAKGRRKASDDEQQAALLAETLGYLPLALEQAGAYICIHEISFAEYLAEWESKREIILDSAHARVMEYPFSVAVTWLTSFDKLTENARHLLYRLAWFSFEPIPVSLLDTSIPDISEDQHKALEGLKAYSLVTQDTAALSFSVHRLVQEVTKRAQRDDSHHRYLQQALSWLDDSFIGDSQDVRNWPQLEPLAQHVKVATECADQSKFWQEPVARLMNRSGLLFNVKAQHHDAEPLMRRALAIDEHSFGPDHPNVATDLNNLAQLLLDTNRPNEAEPLVRRALDIETKASKPNNINIATITSNLAQLLLLTGRFHEAETYIHQAIDICQNEKNIFPPQLAAFLLNNLSYYYLENGRLSEAEHIMLRVLSLIENHYKEPHNYVAVALNNLASLYKETNRPYEAEELLLRALSIDKLTIGHNHPSFATNLLNLAAIYFITSRLDAAKQTMFQALNIYENTLGPNHPNVATTLCDISQLYRTLNNLPEAEKIVRRAVKIDEESYGSSHPSVARDLSSLGLTLLAGNNIQEAELCFRQALSIDENRLGLHHHKVTTHLNNLASLLINTNRSHEAEKMLRRAINIDEHNLGKNHSKLISGMNNLGLVLQGIGNLTEAELILRKALEICQLNYDPEHLETAKALGNLSLVLIDTKNFTEAESSLNQCIKILISIVGEEHPLTATAMGNLALLLWDTDRLSEAEDLMKISLRISKSTLGPHHPDIARGLNNLAKLLLASNRLEEAENYIQQAVATSAKSVLAGNGHTNQVLYLKNYKQICQAVGYTEYEIEVKLSTILSSIYADE